MAEVQRSPSSQTRPSEQYEVEYDFIFYPHVTTIYGALFLGVAFCAIVGNVMILLSFLRFARLRITSNIYLVNLAVCDLFIVLIECPFIVIQYLLPLNLSKSIVQDPFCTFAFFFSGFFGTASTMTLMALSVERFLCILHPLTTMAFATRTETRAKFILMLVWFVTLLPHFGNCALYDRIVTERHSLPGNNYTYDVRFCLSAKPEDNPIYAHFYTTTVFILFYVSSFVTTLGVYIQIIRKLKQMDAKNLYVTSSTRKPRHSKAHTLTVRLMGCTIVSYILCYSLYFYVNLYYVYFGLFRTNGITKLVIANLLGAFNAALNPVMNFVFMKKFRNALMHLCFCKNSDDARNKRCFKQNGKQFQRRERHNGISMETIISPNCSSGLLIQNGSIKTGSLRDIHEVTAQRKRSCTL